MINVREFSYEAEFKNPCVSYTLPDVICSFCSSVRDIDLLRDVDVMKEKWLCNHCGQSYNTAVIEECLVDVVRKKSLRYQLQDLRCAKCRMVKPDNLSDVCSTCSGVYHNALLSSAEFNSW